MLNNELNGILNLFKRREYNYNDYKYKDNNKVYNRTIHLIFIK